MTLWYSNRGLEAKSIACLFWCVFALLGYVSFVYGTTGGCLFGR